MESALGWAEILSPDSARVEQSAAKMYHNDHLMLTVQEVILSFN